MTKTLPIETRREVTAPNRNCPTTHVSHLAIETVPNSSEQVQSEMHDDVTRYWKQALNCQRSTGQERVAEVAARYFLETYRTGIVDVLAAHPFVGLGLFTPEWGKGTVELQVRLRGGVEPQELRITVHMPYRSWLYSWYRTKPEEQALILAQYVAFSRGRNALTREPSTDSAQPKQRGALSEPLRVLLPESSWRGKGWRTERLREGRWVIEENLYFSNVNDLRLITSQTRFDDESDGDGKRSTPYWRNYLSVLRGVEGGYFWGGAWVRSRATDKNGTAYTIASGKASSRGYKINFYLPPNESGFFIYPTLGFFSLDINIADIAGDIPLNDVEGAKDIPAIGTDPKTGTPIDLGAPNVYRIRFRSGYFGQRAGGNLVFGNRRLRIFMGLEGGINLIEARYAEVILGNYQESALRAAAVQSFSGRGTIGVSYQPWHVSLRCEGNWEFYREYAFPRAIPFEGQVEFNEQLQTYERKEVKIDAAGAHTANFFCGGSLFF